MESSSFFNCFSMTDVLSTPLASIVETFLVVMGLLSVVLVALVTKKRNFRSKNNGQQIMDLVRINNTIIKTGTRVSALGFMMTLLYLRFLELFWFWSFFSGSTVNQRCEILYEQEGKLNTCLKCAQPARYNCIGCS